MPEAGKSPPSDPPKKCASPVAVPRRGLESRPGEAGLLKKLLAEMPLADSPLQRVAIGSRFVAVAAGGRVGLASTLGARPGRSEMDLIEGLVGRELAAAAGLLLGAGDFLASLGLAAANAAYSPPADLAAMSVGDLMQRLSPGRRVVVVGDFPFAEELRDAAASLDVLDLRQGHGGMQAGSAAEALAACQVAAISSTALLTRTLDEILALVQPNAIKVLVGPSTPWALSLADLGVDVLGGSVVTNPEAVLAAVADDLPFFQIKRSGVKLAIWQRPGLNI